MITLRHTFLALTTLGAPALAVAAPQPPTEAQQVMVAVEKTLQKHAGEVHTCFGKALADTLDVAGKLELEVTVGAGHKVKDVKVESKADTVTDALAACVTEAAKTWQIDALEPGSSVILPFTFTGQANQYVVSAEDAPLRGPAPKGKTVPPFQVKILVDPVNTRARNVAVTHLVVSPANRVAMHRHPNCAKVLYILKGNARVLGPKGQEPVKLTEGDAVYIPKGFPHVIENMGRQISAEVLQVFAPAGPEKVYRNPQDAAARAEFEVLRGDPGKAPEGAKLVVARGQSAAVVNALGGKASVRTLLDPTLTGDPALAVNVVQFAAGAAEAKHANAGAGEFLWVVSGGGNMKVGLEDFPFAANQAVHVPADQPHAASFKKDEPTTVVQVFSPAPKPETKP
ncbi:MAG: cupin domain-containing protein [Deltaproteobacteria bacterium]|nr:cupin domain-containing protein [Deltaproteobacteria bacterium]